MEDDLNFKWKTTKQSKNLFLISLKFRGKPFLGLAQLSKIYFKYCDAINCIATLYFDD